MISETQTRYGEICIKDAAKQKAKEEAQKKIDDHLKKLFK